MNPTRVYVNTRQQMFVTASIHGYIQHALRVLTMPGGTKTKTKYKKKNEHNKNQKPKKKCTKKNAGESYLVQARHLVAKGGGGLHRTRQLLVTLRLRSPCTGMQCQMFPHLQ